MEFKSPTGKSRQPESSLVEKIMALLRYRGFWVKKLHGSKFQSGLPDLILSHPGHGVKFIEAKMPVRCRQEFGGLSELQIKSFLEMSQAGCKIYIVTDHLVTLKIIEGPPNWKTYRDYSKVRRPAGL